MEFETKRSPENSSDAKVFRVEDRVSGFEWIPGLTWTGEAADRALASARRYDPTGDWILCEVLL